MYRCWGLGAIVAALPIQRSIAGGWLLWLKVIWVVHQNPACEVLSDRTTLSIRPGERPVATCPGLMEKAGSLRLDEGKTRGTEAGEQPLYRVPFERIRGS
jgi:hypothetical protein